MATYKVIQDIEAEDKLLGPLTLRQFIYAIIVIAFGGLAFLAAKISPFFVIPFFPPMLFFGLLAAPFGRDQSSEVWLLAKIRFAFKPRRRIWDQSGLKELVTITVPKKIEKHLTDGLDQSQVKSRLSALASTLDSRGWAIKNVVPGTYSSPLYAATQATGGSDRLVDVSVTTPTTPAYDYQNSDDMLDEQNNPTAQKLSTLIEQSEQTRRQHLIDTMRTGAVAPQATAGVAAAAQQDNWYTDPNVATIPAPPTAAPAVAAPVNQVADPAEQQLLKHIHDDKAAADAANSHIKRIPTAEELAAAQAAEQKAAVVHAQELKRLANNDDLNIATIARQADKNSDGVQILDDGEVVISLH